jgi:hypothetical protein
MDTRECTRARNLHNGVDRAFFGNAHSLAFAPRRSTSGGEAIQVADAGQGS